MDKLSKSLADSIIVEYKGYVQEKVNDINKNFGEMDLENANIQDDFQEIIDAMIINCRNMLNEIDQYTFY